MTTAVRWWVIATGVGLMLGGWLPWFTSGHLEDRTIPGLIVLTGVTVASIGLIGKSNTASFLGVLIPSIITGSFAVWVTFVSTTQTGMGVLLVVVSSGVGVRTAMEIRTKASTSNQNSDTESETPAEQHGPLNPGNGAVSG